MANPADPDNPAQAFPPVTPPHFTSPLYYGNGCDTRLRPHVVNSLISENLALLDRVDLAYNLGKLSNTRTAIEYIVQRGLPKFIEMDGGPNFYTGAADPPITRYNDGLTLCVVPKCTNDDRVRVDFNSGCGWVPVLRKDFTELRKGDLPANVPALIAYYHGIFFHIAPTGYKEEKPPAPEVEGRTTRLVAAIPFGAGQSIPAGTYVQIHSMTRIFHNSLKTSTWDGKELRIGEGEDGLWHIEWLASYGQISRGVFVEAIRSRGGAMLEFATYGYLSASPYSAADCTAVGGGIVDLQVGDVMTFWTGQWSYNNSLGGATMVSSGNFGAIWIPNVWCYRLRRS